MGDFERDTRIEKIGEGVFHARLSRDWEIWGPNGGYVAAIALRAVGEVAAVPRPASFAAHFLSVARFDDVDVTVRAIKSGRRSESFAVTIAQGDRPVLEGLARTAADGPGLEHDVAEIPEAKRPAELRNLSELVPDDAEPPYPFWNNFRIRPVWPDRFRNPERRPHAPEYREWWSFHPRATFDDPWVDAGRALLMIDTGSWIAACQPHPNGKYIAPNIDVGVWFHRNEPESEWLLSDHTCAVAEGGLMGTHARIWSENGRLLASGGAQLFCVPRPPD